MLFFQFNSIHSSFEFSKVTKDTQKRVKNMVNLTLGLLLASGLLSNALSNKRTETTSKPPTATLLSENENSKTIFVGRTIPEFNQDVFLGIKYADQPIRFTPSKLKTEYATNASNSGILDISAAGLTKKSGYTFYNATQYGNDCPGYGSDTTNEVKMGLIKLNEDCLNLNIIRPKLNQQEGETELLPVMLWIYGGGWQQGATADPRYFFKNNF